MVGADGEHTEATNAAMWVAGVEDFPDHPRPTTLFLLDTCYAGSAARLDWLRAANADTRAWVIAATSAHGLAYDGCFTEAAAKVFAQISEGDIDFFPAHEFVPFGDVVEHIRREVSRVSGNSQVVYSTPVDGRPVPPFFPNRRPPLARSLSTVRHALDSAALPFLDLDVALDPSHFLERASGTPRTSRLRANRLLHRPHGTARLDQVVATVSQGRHLRSDRGSRLWEVCSAGNRRVRGTPPPTGG